jgi:hypothetical protein
MCFHQSACVLVVDTASANNLTTGKKLLANHIIEQRDASSLGEESECTNTYLGSYYFLKSHRNGTSYHTFLYD